VYIFKPFVDITDKYVRMSIFYKSCKILCVGMMLFLNSVNTERILIRAYKITRTYCFCGLFILVLKVM